MEEFLCFTLAFFFIQLRMEGLPCGNPAHLPARRRLLRPTSRAPDAIPTKRIYVLTHSRRSAKRDITINNISSDFILTPRQRQAVVDRRVRDRRRQIRRWSKRFLKSCRRMGGIPGIVCYFAMLCSIAAIRGEFTSKRCTSSMYLRPKLI